MVISLFFGNLTLQVHQVDAEEAKGGGGGSLWKIESAISIKSDIQACARLVRGVTGRFSRKRERPVLDPPRRQAPPMSATTVTERDRLTEPGHAQLISWITEEKFDGDGQPTAQDGHTSCTEDQSSV